MFLVHVICGHLFILSICIICILYVNLYICIVGWISQAAVEITLIQKLQNLKKCVLLVIVVTLWLHGTTGNFTLVLSKRSSERKHFKKVRIRIRSFLTYIFQYIYISIHIFYPTFRIDILFRLTWLQQPYIHLYIGVALSSRYHRTNIASSPSLVVTLHGR